MARNLLIIEDQVKLKVFDIDTFSCFVKLQVKIVLKRKQRNNIRIHIIPDWFCFLKKIH